MTCEYTAAVKTKKNIFWITLSSFRRNGRRVWHANYHKNDNEVGLGGRTYPSFRVAKQQANAFMRFVAPDQKAHWAVDNPKDTIERGKVFVRSRRSGRTHHLFVRVGPYTNFVKVDSPVRASRLAKHPEKFFKILIRFVNAKQKKDPKNPKVSITAGELKRLRRLSILA